MPALNDWKAHGIRATVFTAQPYDTATRPQLEQIFKTEVESTEIKGPLKDVTEIASMGTGKLTVATSGVRCDFVWQAEETPEGLGLGKTDAVFDTFLPNIVQWVSGCQGLSRVALGLHALLRVPSRVDGYTLMAQMVPELRIDPDNYSDVQLTLNKPKLVSVGGTDVRFNRIAKWAVIAHQLNQFQIVSGQVIGTTMSEEFSLQCELDLSTPVTNVANLNGGQFAESLHALGELTKEVLSNGTHN